MSKCVKLRRKRRQPCIGDLDTEIVLQTRAITPPTLVDFSETFATAATVWAMIETLHGKTEFDDSNVERNISHEITIRYVANVSTETWILHDAARYDVVTVEDYEERHEWLVLRCERKGATSKAVNDA